MLNTVLLLLKYF